MCDDSIEETFYLLILIHLHQFILIPHRPQSHFLQFICSLIAFHQDLPCLFRSCSSCNLFKVCFINTLMNQECCFAIFLLVLFVKGFLCVCGIFRKCWLTIFNNLNYVLVLHYCSHLHSPTIPILSSEYMKICCQICTSLHHLICCLSFMFWIRTVLYIPVVKI